LYIAVCDDQKDDLETLVLLLRRWQEERRISFRYKAFSNTSVLLDEAKREHFTVYLLDIIMQGLDGIEVAREIRSFDETAEIVFLTSSSDFAYESYGVRALDYILKPVDEKRLYPLLDRLSVQKQRPQEGLTVKSDSALRRILFSDLTYVEVRGKHLFFNLADGSVRESTGTLSEYELLLLNRPEFVRVHRSYIVNLFHVEELSSGGIITFSGQNLPVSRLLYPQIQKAYMKLLFQETEA